MTLKLFTYLVDNVSISWEEVTRQWPLVVAWEVNSHLVQLLAWFFLCLFAILLNLFNLWPFSLLPHSVVLFYCDSFSSNQYFVFSFYVKSNITHPIELPNFLRSSFAIRVNFLHSLPSSFLCSHFHVFYLTNLTIAVFPYNERYFTCHNRNAKHFATWSP